MGTRGSALALAQTRLVIERLAERFPSTAVEICPIHTRGDHLASVSLSVIGGQGVFVKEIEQALLAGRIDFAVHSLKDLPSALPPGLALAAILPREDPRDVLIARSAPSLVALPAGARVATSAPRRFTQLHAARPDLHLVDIRGNVDTRLRRLRAGDFDAIVLAAAGLHRLGRAGEITEYLPLDVCLPAVGQGALAVEARVDDADLLAMLQAIDHPPTRAAVTAERAVLRALGGGCRIPIAAYARVQASPPSSPLTAWEKGIGSPSPAAWERGEGGTCAEFGSPGDEGADLSPLPPSPRRGGGGLPVPASGRFRNGGQGVRSAPGAAVPGPKSAHMGKGDERVQLTLRARIAAPDGSQFIDGVITGDPAAAEALGEKLGKELLEGARSLLDAIDATFGSDDVPLSTEPGE
ncbi:MAG: hydroxymethylbilane synthase [Chloroflexi bacterium]|nr:hydroxymethylbilane synthase [Chloroflexota bacterium]